MNEKEAIQKLRAFIEQRIAEGATEEEVEKLYDDLQTIQVNDYIGDLFGEQ